MIRKYKIKRKDATTMDSPGGFHSNAVLKLHVVGSRRDIEAVYKAIAKAVADIERR